MPQMMPMDWILMYPTLFILMTMTNTTIFYIITSPTINSKKSLKYEYSYPKWSW